MKLIRSNKKGFRIHSPSVYHLVTEVLFPRFGYRSFEQLSDFLQNKNEIEVAGLIISLIEYSKPERVLFFGNSDIPGQELIKAFFPSVLFFLQEPGTPSNNPGLFPFVIFDRYFPGVAEVFGPSVKSVWCLKNLGESREMAQFFRTLFFDERIAVTIQYKNFGIIIVDKKIPKQNYVIK